MRPIALNCVRGSRGTFIFIEMLYKAWMCRLHCRHTGWVRDKDKTLMKYKATYSIAEAHIYNHRVVCVCVCLSLGPAGWWRSQCHSGCFEAVVPAATPPPGQTTPQSPLSRLQREWRGGQTV